MADKLLSFSVTKVADRLHAQHFRVFRHRRDSDVPWSRYDGHVKLVTMHPKRPEDSLYTIQLRSMRDDEKQLSFGEFTSYIFKQERLRERQAAQEAKAAAKEAKAAAKEQSTAAAVATVAAIKAAALEEVAAKKSQKAAHKQATTAHTAAAVAAAPLPARTPRRNRNSVTTSDTAPTVAGSTHDKAAPVLLPARVPRSTRSTATTAGAAAAAGIRHDKEAPAPLPARAPRRNRNSVTPSYTGETSAGSAHDTAAPSPLSACAFSHTRKVVLTGPAGPSPAFSAGDKAPAAGPKPTNRAGHNTAGSKAVQKWVVKAVQQQRKTDDADDAAPGSTDTAGGAAAAARPQANRKALLAAHKAAITAITGTAAASTAATAALQATASSRLNNRADTGRLLRSRGAPYKWTGHGPLVLDTAIILGGSEPAQGGKAGTAVSADDAPPGGSGTDKAARTPGKPSTAKSSRQEAATGPADAVVYVQLTQPSRHNLKFSPPQLWVPKAQPCMPVSELISPTSDAGTGTATGAGSMQQKDQAVRM